MHTVPTNAPHGRVKRRVLGTAMVLALTAGACGGGSGSTTPSTTTAETETTTSAPTPPTTEAGDTSGFRSGLVFVSTDDTAAVGSRTVFTVTDEGGTRSSVTAVGNGVDTRAQLELAPGTYTIAQPPAAVGRYGSSQARPLTATEVTIPAPDSATPEQFVTVDFSLDLHVNPIDLVLDRVTATTAELSWSATDDTQISSYQLFRFDGLTLGDTATTTPIELTDPLATTVRLTELAPETAYTMALIATDATGTPLPTQSLSLVTSAHGLNATSFALAANTIMATDFAALNVEPVDTHRARITLNPTAINRISSSGVAGVDPSALTGAGCIVGTPFMASTDVAGDQAFFGVIDTCETAPQGWRRAAAPSPVTTAIVDTEVALLDVYSYLEVLGHSAPACYDSTTATDRGATAIECAGGADNDGDGIDNRTEALIGTDPDNPDSDGDGIPDGVEFFELGTLPTHADSDFDTIPDQAERDAGTDPLNPDSDGDGCWDAGETTIGTDPLDADSVGECPGGADGSSWHSAVDGGRESYLATIASDETDTATVDEVAPVETLDAPPELGTGDVQVTLLWASGDDLDLYVTDPNGERVWYDAPSTSTGAFLDVDDRGGDCSSVDARAENVFWATAAPAGTYTVEIDNYAPCSEGAAAKVQVRVGGELIIDQTLSVGVDGPITFTVGGPAGLRSPAAAAAAAVNEPAGLRSPAAVPAGAQRRPARQTPQLDLGFECEGAGTASMGIYPDFSPFHELTYTLTKNQLDWNLRVGAVASITPRVEVVGEVECELTLPSVVIPLESAGVPVSIEIEPSVSGEANASITLEGPSVALTLGFRSDGTAWWKTGWCGALCGLKIDKEHDSGPIADLDIGEVTVNIEGELEVGVNFDVKLMVGVDVGVFAGKAGLSVILTPVNVTLEASAGSQNCIAGAIGGKVDVGVGFEGSVLWVFDIEDRFSLFEFGADYPGASFERGDCGDD